MSRNPTSSSPFQVHLRGIVELLSRNIYSSADVFVRELLQNGCDAIAARAEREGHAGRIRITPASAGGAFVVEDDGIGLTAEDVGDFLSIVGRSSKRDILDMPRSDRLGQFGIGLLSCFMVSDDIVVRSRALGGATAVEWVGHADGTYTVTELPDEVAAAMPVGTRVELTPRPDSAHLVTPERVLALASRYGRYLPTAVTVELPGGAESINRDPVFLEPSPSRSSLEFGREVLGAEPFEAIPVWVPATQTRGTAYVLPFAPSPGAKQSNRVYLGGMLLSERVEALLPEWAFFVRVVADTKGLRPTASREALIDDDALEHTRSELGAALRRWVIGLGSAQPHRLAAFLAVHHLSLRALLLHDDELARFLVPWLPVDTSAGPSTYGELARRGTIRYTETVDEFRQLAGIARADAPIVNAGYVYDTEIMRMLPDIIPGAVVELTTVADEIDALDMPPLSERAAARALQSRADAALSDLDCMTSVRSFAPDTVPALYVADPQVLRRLRREQASESGGLWANVMGRIGESDPEVDGSASTLALNWRNRLIRTLASVTDDAVVARTIRILYVQSLLAGHRPLSAADRTALTDAMTDIVHLSVGIDAPTLPSIEG
ncbi:HSP90 family protein [Stackebrandtia soli]|uniref:HSP90 family protein n=1 Tax=Stackebrandtia soli TaxID=1892856 RepID=UPI0039EA1565